MEATVDRRSFLQQSALAAAVAILPWLESCKAKPIPPGLNRPRFLTMTLDKPMLEEIGKAYLAKFPDDNNIDTLVRKLMKAHPGTDPLGKEELTSFFRKEIAADFINDRVLVISGWVLSTTEARQCALYVITDHGS
jgi:hypothetical protein